MKRGVVALILALLIPLANAGAIDIIAAGGSLGILIISNTVEGSAPNPVVNTLGGFMVLRLAEPELDLVPSLDILWLNYENRDGRAIPTEVETGNGNNVFALGFLLDLPVCMTFRFGPPVTENTANRFAASIFGGTSFLFRICTKGDTDPESAALMEENLAAVASWLWGGGRWFYPMIGTRFSVVLQDNFTFQIGVKAYIPIFNLWNAEPNVIDAGMLNIQLAMQAKL